MLGSKLVLVRSMSVLELGNMVLELVRSKLVLLLGSKLALVLVRSRLELVLGSKVLVRSNHSSPCGIRTNLLRWSVRR